MQKMKDNYDINDPANVDEIDREAMDNMYSILTKQETYDSLMDQKGRVLMIFNPLDGAPDVDQLIDDLIEYYSSPDIEMYERCAVLVNIKNSTDADKRIQLEGFDSEIDFTADWDLDEDNDR